jgi:hypothetical protein
MVGIKLVVVGGGKVLYIFTHLDAAHNEKLSHGIVVSDVTRSEPAVNERSRRCGRIIVVSFGYAWTTDVKLTGHVGGEVVTS